MKRIITALLLLTLAGPALADAPRGAYGPQSKPELELIISLPQRRLTVLLGGLPIRWYPVAVGAPEHPTPLGEFTIVHKAVNWGGGFGSRWLGLSVPWGTYGIHGTNNPVSIGKYASHGCIRLYNRDVEALYELIPHQTKVTIIGPPHRLNLSLGSKGSDVVDLQERLRALGYYEGPTDGVFGKRLEETVKRYQKEHGLLVTGSVLPSTYRQLGLLGDQEGR